MKAATIKRAGAISALVAGGILILAGPAGRAQEAPGGTPGATPSPSALAPSPSATPSASLEPIRLVAHQDVDSKSFTTSGSCATCHAQSARAQAMRDAKGRGIAPYDLWQSTMMANAARDPLWRAVVSMEVAATPSRKAEIEAKCLRCHSPMASTEAARAKVEIGLDILYGTDAKAQLALDGVSCTVCHQIQPKNLGKPESYSGHYEIGTEREIFGPHAEPVQGPMSAFTGFTPREGQHLRKSALCATCHTLFTDAYDPKGKLTGQTLPEQTPYLEWRNSIFNDEDDGKGASCQSCHVPTRDQDGTAIKTRIAHAPPGFDFPFVNDREPFGRHIFVGGNTLIPAILRDHADELRPRATPEAFNATVAAAKDQLQKRTARLKLKDLKQSGDRLEFSVAVSTMTGHKFPTAHPTRRAWLQVVVSDSAGRVLFNSGGFDPGGRILDSRGKPLPGELAGGPTYPHRSVVRSGDEVQVYESVMADAEGAATYLLIRGGSYLKDNRILPLGWKADHKDAKAILPVGVGKDPDFLGGRDSVRYEVELPASSQGPLRVEARLVYQVLGSRYADELFRYDTREIQAFKRYWKAADRRPVVIAHAEGSLP